LKVSDTQRRTILRYPTEKNLFYARLKGKSILHSEVHTVSRNREYCVIILFRIKMHEVLTIVIRGINLKTFMKTQSEYTSEVCGKDIIPRVVSPIFLRGKFVE